MALVSELARQVLSAADVDCDGYRRVLAVPVLRGFHGEHRTVNKKYLPPPAREVNSAVSLHPGDGNSLAPAIPGTSLTRS